MHETIRSLNNLNYFMYTINTTIRGDQFHNAKIAAATKANNTNGEVATETALEAWFVDPGAEEALGAAFEDCGAD
jgi:hypothetical protein